MIIRIEDIQKICSTILSAVDVNKFFNITEIVEMDVANKKLNLKVTNKEYFAEASLDIDDDVEFNASVDANLFLKLISKITTDTVEMTVTSTALVIKGNGTYKIPLIFNGSEMLKVPEISITNKTSEFDIDSKVLYSIIEYNATQLGIGTTYKPVQKLYYIDDKGAITFTSGACVNSFSLPNPIKILLNQRLVKLFKLFPANSTVHFELGYDAINGSDIIQTKVKFYNDNISVTAILSCDDAMLNTVPVDAIRERATKVYPYSVTISKRELQEALDRLMIFNANCKDVTIYRKFAFGNDSVVIADDNNTNCEELYYKNELNNCKYSTLLDIGELQAVINTCFEDYLTINFGDTQAIVISRQGIYNVIPECEI